MVIEAGDGEALSGVGGLLRERRVGLGLTLAAVAGRAGLAVSYLSMIETGRVAHPPSAKLLNALAGVLELDPEVVMRAAAWEQTPAAVRREVAQLQDRAAAGRELARWLAQHAPPGTSPGTSPRTSPRTQKPTFDERGLPRATTPDERGLPSPPARGVDLDQLFRSGELRQRIEQAMGDRPTARADDKPQPHARPHPQATTFPVGRVPLINKVAAGYPSGFTDLDYPAQVADEYVLAPGVRDPDAFAARVTGESMLPDYKPGDIVVFSPLADLADGCDCFARLEPNHENTIKRVYFETDAHGEELIRLQPLNPAFTALTLPRDEVAGLYRAVWRMTAL